MKSKNPQKITPDNIILGRIYRNSKVESIRRNLGDDAHFVYECIKQKGKKVLKCLNNGVIAGEPKYTYEGFWDGFWDTNTKVPKKSNIWSFAVSFKSRKDARQAKKQFDALVTPKPIVSTKITKIAKNKIK